jgi:hypothetical protein
MACHKLFEFYVGIGHYAQSQVIGITRNAYKTVILTEA